MTQLTEENASQIVVEFLKKRKNTDKIDVAMVEREEDCWKVRGTSPIEFGGATWPERFVVVVDLKGKIRSSEFALL